MYLLGLLIIDQLFLGSINILNLTIGIRSNLIDIEAIKYIFCVSRFCFLYLFLCSAKNTAMC